MPTIRNWEEIIDCHCIPTERNGVFWLPSNKIFIYCLVKEHDYFYAYVVNHEKNHYMNYNYSRCKWIGIMKDIWNEWKMSWDMTFDNELKNSHQQYQEKLSAVKEKKVLIKDLYVLMLVLGEKRASKKEMQYADIVRCFKPYHICSYLLLPFVGLTLFWMARLFLFLIYNILIFLNVI